MGKKFYAEKQNTHTVQYPFQKERAGISHTLFEKVGPFTLKISNKGFYDLYEVTVTGGVVILKNLISHPGLEGICRALITARMEGKITKEVFEHYHKQFA